MSLNNLAQMIQKTIDAKLKTHICIGCQLSTLSSSKLVELQPEFFF